MSRQRNSGSTTATPTMSRMSPALFAIVVFFTPRNALSWSALRCGHCGGVKEEVHLSHRVDHPGRPDVGPPALQRRRSLAGELGRHARADVRVLLIEVLGAERLDDRQDLARSRLRDLRNPQCVQVRPCRRAPGASVASIALRRWSVMAALSIRDLDDEVRARGFEFEPPSTADRRRRRSAPSSRRRSVILLRRKSGWRRH